MMAQMDALTNTQMSKVLNQCPAVVVDAVVLQNEQLADIPGSDVTGDLHSSTAVVLTVYFDHLPHRNPFISQWKSSQTVILQWLINHEIW